MGLCLFLSGAVECKIQLKTDGTQQCIAKLDEPLTFQLLSMEKIHLKKDNIIIFKLSNKKVEDVHKNYSNRLQRLTNATFTLDVVTMTDSGNYQLEAFNHEGRSLHIINLHLEVQGNTKHTKLLTYINCKDEMNNVLS